MGMTVKVSFKSSTKPEDLDDAVQEFRNALSELQEGFPIKVTIDILDDISLMKKKYFAMVVALGKEVGYVSHKEKEIFKVQIRDHMKIRSIEEITTKEEMSAVIEGLIQFAAEHYQYTFEDARTPIDIIFTGAEGREEQ
jgi:hypothetical protein